MKAERPPFDGDTGAALSMVHDMLGIPDARPEWMRTSQPNRSE